MIINQIGHNQDKRFTLDWLVYLLCKRESIRKQRWQWSVHTHASNQMNGDDNFSQVRFELHGKCHQDNANDGNINKEMISFHFDQSFNYKLHPRQLVGHQNFHVLPTDSALVVVESTPILFRSIKNFCWMVHHMLPLLTKRNELITSQMFIENNQVTWTNNRPFSLG